MLPDLIEVKQKRKQLNLTQSELSEKTGVSQSLIAKVESEKIIPTYTKAKKIFDFFESIREKTQLRAMDLMKVSIKKIQVSAKIKDAIKIMEKNAISQVPVLEGEQIVGTISENIIVDKMQKEKNLQKFREFKVSDIMGDALPTVNEMSPFRVISALLDHTPAVLVLKSGKIKGIISKSDLLGAMLKKQ